MPGTFHKPRSLKPQPYGRCTVWSLSIPIVLAQAVNTWVQAYNAHAAGRIGVRLMSVSEVMQAALTHFIENYPAEETEIEVDGRTGGAR